MIQRKQTLHFLAIVALMAAMLFMPLATLTTSADLPAETIETAADGSIVKTTVLGNSDVVLRAWGIYENGEQSIPLTLMAILIIITAVVAMVAIFLYRRRSIQLRLCFVLGILLIGVGFYVGMFVWQLHQIAARQNFAAISYSVADLFPLLGLVFVWLGYRGVAHDVELIKSLNRIR